MGLLEELEEEAQKRRDSGDASSLRKTEYEALYRTRLEPALDALHGFLCELIAKVRAVRPRNALRYQVQGYGEIVGYIEHEYRLDDRRQPSSREIVLEFDCAVATDECPLVDVEGASRVKALAGSFQRHRIGGMQALRKDASGDVVAATFRARGRIPLCAHFHADTGSGQLRIRFDNLEGLGTVTKSVPAAEVGEDLYDRIGRFILRDSNTLLREDLPEAYRNQLRSKVQQQTIRRRWEARIADRREAEVAQLRREYTLAGKVGGWFERVRNFGRIGGALGFRRRGI
ncbi:MAG TPA: hypothetical protein VHE32_03995 [Rhodanobacteraceae bacterium]|nr:hypothetical protein [Rhodanobacteraceae bacterium]